MFLYKEIAFNKRKYNKPLFSDNISKKYVALSVIKQI